MVFMKVDILSIYRGKKNKKPELIHSYGLNVTNWEEKERLEKLIAKIPISYGISKNDVFKYEAKIILNGKNTINIYPQKDSIAPWGFSIQDNNKLEGFVVGRGDIGFTFKGRKYNIYLVSTIYQEKLKAFQKAIEDFRGF